MSRDATVEGGGFQYALVMQNQFQVIQIWVPVQPTSRRIYASAHI